MTTECTTNQIEFEGIGRRRTVATFTGGHVTSDGGLLLQHEVDKRLGILASFARFFVDHTHPHL